MMAPFEFTGSTVSCYIENEVTTIGIGDDDVDPTNFVIISRLEEADSQNSAEEEIGIQTNFSKFESVAAITKIVFKENQLHILIKPEKSEEVGASEIDIVLTVNDVALHELARFLYLIFDDKRLVLSIDIGIQ